MTTIRTFKVWEIDSWSRGPRLLWEEIYDVYDDREVDSCDEEYEVDDEETSSTTSYSLEKNKYNCYQIILGVGYDKQIFLQSFNNLDDAELFSKIQYKLHTGDFPYIDEIKRRAKFNIPEYCCALTTEENSNEGEKSYLIIVSDNYFKAHSLNPFAEW